MTLKEFGDLLLTVTPNVHHYHTIKPQEVYILWMEYDAAGVYADNRRVAKRQKIWLELYTPYEYDPILDNLEHVLAEAGICFDGPETDYDTVTDVITYRFECEVIIHGQI